MSEETPHELERWDEPKFDWQEVTGKDLLDAAREATAEGYALRISPVGYGAALRVTYGTVNGDVAGWTVTSGLELHMLLGGLVAPGWQQFVRKRLVPPSGRKRR